MRWPWKRHKPSDLLVVSWSGQTLAYVRAALRPDGTPEVRQFGVERQGADSHEAFARRLLDLGFKGARVHVMLRPEQYQFLLIDAPAVAPEEVRAAARWQIRDMVDMHMDDITLDVMRVGAGKVGAPGHLFVAVVGNAVLSEVLRLGQALQWDVPVVDIQETAQRNLQTLLARREARVERAYASLMMVHGRQALLTISANEELYYTRRIDLGPGFMERRWGPGHLPEGNNPDPQSAESLGYASTGNAEDDDVAQRFVVEMQRSLDVWDRTWSDLPLDGLWAEAGPRTQEMSHWLSQELGFAVKPMVLAPLFPGFEGGTPEHQAACLPLLGILLRVEDRNL